MSDCACAMHKTRREELVRIVGDNEDLVYVGADTASQLLSQQLQCPSGDRTTTKSSTSG